jgi:hypothetical protein
MASGAGLNRIGAGGGVFLLDAITSATAVVSSPLTAYGTLNVNDSGGQATEGIGYSKWVFHLVATDATALSSLSVTMLGTISPFAYSTFTGVMGGKTPTPQVPQVGPAYAPGYSNATGFVPGVAPWEWFIIPGPSEQSGTGNIANPLTAYTPLLYTSMPLVAVRAVVTSALTGNGTARVYGFAVP